MLKALTLTNFQSHKTSLLTFSPGVNVVIGPTDVGKSALIRSLSWIVHNRPSGDQFISHGEKEVSATLEFDNVSITRSKGQKNSYKLDDMELVGFGQDVPAEVSAAINMNELNIQYQHDGPFLLGESAGAVARTLNKIVNLDKIDESLFNVRRLETENRTSISSIKGKLADLDSELESKPNFVLIDGILTQLNRYYVRAMDCENTVDNIEELKKKIDFCQRNLDNIIIPDVDFIVIESKIADLEKKSREKERLTRLISSLLTQQKGISTYEEEMERCKKNLKLLCPSLCPLCGQSVTHTLLLGAESVEGGVQKENGGKSSVL